MTKIGIAGYGAYIPKKRIKVEEIARVWRKDPKKIKCSLNIEEKAVPDYDEDTATISVEAAKNAISYAGINPSDIEAVYIGSESHPYVVKTTSAIVAQAIGATPDMTAADLEFACKAGTAGMQMCMGLCKSGMIKYGMAIGADTAQGRPGDALEYTAAAGGAAFIIGSEKLIAELVDTVSYTTDTPDFWRREGQEYPKHGGRFTGTPAYFRHVKAATEKILEKTGYKLSDMDHVVFHQPNGKFPLRAAKNLGIPKEKLKHGLLTPIIGNTYSGSTPLGLAAILDIAKPGEIILATSYGSGAGSDSFIFKVTTNITGKKGKRVRDYIENKEYVDYARYIVLKKKLKM
jgi:hydroxymethylglutaryl-CoA synthase